MQQAYIHGGSSVESGLEPRTQRQRSRDLITRAPWHPTVTKIVIDRGLGNLWHPNVAKIVIDRGLGNLWHPTVAKIVIDRGLGNLSLIYIPALPRHPNQLNDSRCKSSRTEVGVSIAYHQFTTRTLPKVVHNITGGASPLLYLQGRVPDYLCGSK
ncbi:hypothetical protein AVEN_132254-1 [Araneus ventricosus]|uniref:Uncharacterized protein n=1 Tax=Araneus ventricosus TaxID=182803 RepID=A0A4Y2M104_ARAVE|nr:hypothetical protein AVEN_132254-1 [Araneus ventricosus]